MVLTVDNITKILGGAANRNILICDIDFDISYPTGGEAFAASQFGWGEFDLVLVSPTGGLIFEFDYANELLLAFEQGFRTGSTAAAAAGNATNVEDFAAAETSFEAAGVAVDTNISMGALRQIGNTVNLSSITNARVFAIGV